MGIMLTIKILIFGCAKRVRHDAHFTLLELLICLSILMVFVSLLQPALTKMTTESEMIQCQKNLSSIGMNTSLFVDDKGEYPLIQKSPVNMQNAWRYQLGEYIIGENFIDPNGVNRQLQDCSGLYIPEELVTGVMACPSGLDIILDTFQIQKSQINPGRIGGYGWNNSAIASNDMALGAYDVESPSETFSVGDSVYALKRMMFMHRFMDPSIDAVSQVIMETHGESLNVLFFDGHVSKMTDSDIRVNTNDESYYFNP
jgi:prepilin-type processing-associated H-X9-DG protein